MGKEIVINSDATQTRIAIVENGRLAEMYVENAENERTLGDIYLGRVRRIMPSIQAAFIDIGQKSDAFLHFSDIADNLQDINSFLELKEPKVSDVELDTTHSRYVQRRKPHHETSDEFDEDESESDSTHSDGKSKLANKKSRGRRHSSQHRYSKKDNSKSGDEGEQERPRSESFLQRDKPILVKIVKEPISAKGSRVSTDISLAGRFVVLVPLANYVAVSKKIQSYKERRRLRALATSLLPPGFGVIVRTVAEGKNAQALDTDMSLLVDKWRKIEAKLKENPAPPTLLHQDVNMVSSVIRDLFSDNYERILVDDYKMYRNIKGYIQAVAPDMVPAVQLHKGDDGVFTSANIAKDAAQAFEKRVDLPSGGYLIIEHTEAMHVIDVNSGRAGKGLSQEENSLKVNLESAKSVAHQLRLRDLGGIIVVDFIDLRHDKNRKKVFDELRTQFRKDRAVTKILPMSDFGLMQITRQRMRPSITTQVPSANGSPDETSLEKSHLATRDLRKEPKRRRKVEPQDMIAKLEGWLSRYKSQGNRQALVLKVHPFTAAYLRKPTPGLPTRWLFKYRIRVKISEDSSLDPGQYRFFDSKTGKNLSRGRSKFSNKKSKDKKDKGVDARHPDKRKNKDVRDTQSRPKSKQGSKPKGDGRKSASQARRDNSKRTGQSERVKKGSSEQQSRGSRAKSGNGKSSESSRSQQSKARSQSTKSTRSESDSRSSRNNSRKSDNQRVEKDQQSSARSDSRARDQSRTDKSRNSNLESKRDGSKKPSTARDSGGSSDKRQPPSRSNPTADKTTGITRAASIAPISTTKRPEPTQAAPGKEVSRSSENGNTSSDSSSPIKDESTPKSNS